MSDYSLAIFIMLIAVVISLTSISIKLSQDECINCPTYWDRYNNSTIDYFINDVQDRKECEEKYPMGYYHTMIGNKCKVTFWKSDLD